MFSESFHMHSIFSLDTKPQVDAIREVELFQIRDQNYLNVVRQITTSRINYTDYAVG